MSRYMDFRAGAMKPFGAPSRDNLPPLQFGASDSSSLSSKIKDEFLDALYFAISTDTKSDRKARLSAVRQALAQSESSQKKILIAISAYFNKLFKDELASYGISGGKGKRSDPLSKLNDSMSRYSAASLDELTRARDAVAGLASELELISSALANIIIPACASTPDSSDCLAFAREIADHIRLMSQKLSAIVSGSFSKNHQAIANALLNQDAAKARALIRASSDPSRQELLDRILARISPMLTASVLSNNSLKSLESQVNDILRSSNAKGKNINQIVDSMIRANIDTGSLSEQNRAQLNHLLSKLVEMLNIRNPYNFIGGARRGVSVPNRLQNRVAEDNLVNKTLQSATATDLIYISFSREYAKLISQVMACGRELCNEVDHGSAAISPQSPSYLNLVEALNRLSTYDQKLVIASYSTLATDDRSRKLRTSYLTALELLSSALVEFGKDTPFKTAECVRHLKGLIDMLKRWNESAEKNLQGRKYVYSNFIGGGRYKISKLVNFGDWSSQLQSAVDRSQVAKIQYTAAKSSTFVDKHQSALSSKFISGYEQRINNALVIYHSLKNNIVRESQTVMKRMTGFPPQYRKFIDLVSDLKKLALVTDCAYQTDIDYVNQRRIFDNAASDIIDNIARFRLDYIRTGNYPIGARTDPARVLTNNETREICQKFGKVLATFDQEYQRLVDGYRQNVDISNRQVRSLLNTVYQLIKTLILDEAKNTYSKDVIHTIDSILSQNEQDLHRSIEYPVANINSDNSVIPPLPTGNLAVDDLIRKPLLLNILSKVLDSTLEQIITRTMKPLRSVESVSESSYQQGEAFIMRYGNYFDTIGEILSRQYASVIELMHLMTAINRYVSRTITNLSIGKIGIKSVSEVINSLKTTFNSKIFTETKKNMQLLRTSVVNVVLADETNLLSSYEIMRTNAFNLAKQFMPLRLLLITVNIINGENLRSDMLTEGKILDDICNYVAHTFITLRTQQSIVSQRDLNREANQSLDTGLFYHSSGKLSQSLEQLAKYVDKQKIPNNKKNIMFASVVSLASIYFNEGTAPVPANGLAAYIPQTNYVPERTVSSIQKLISFIACFYSAQERPQVVATLTQLLDNGRSIGNEITKILSFIGDAITNQGDGKLARSINQTVVIQPGYVYGENVRAYRPNIIPDNSSIVLDALNEDAIVGKLFTDSLSLQSIPRISRIDKANITLKNSPEDSNLPKAFRKLFSRADFYEYVLPTHEVLSSLLHNLGIRVSEFLCNYVQTLNSMLYGAIGGLELDDLLEPLPITQDTDITRSQMKFPFGFSPRKFLFTKDEMSNYVWSDGAQPNEEPSIADTSLDRPFSF